jgi:hypothetical protein
LGWASLWICGPGNHSAGVEATPESWDKLMFQKSWHEGKWIHSTASCTSAEEFTPAPDLVQ